MWAIFSTVLLSESLKGRRMKTRTGRLRLPIAQPPQTLPLWLGMHLGDLFICIVGFCWASSLKAAHDSGMS